MNCARIVLSVTPAGKTLPAGEDEGRTPVAPAKLRQCQSEDCAKLLTSGNLLIAAHAGDGGALKS
jgi:hypothetical protein